MQSCPFCTDYVAGRDIVWESEHFFLRWDAFPVAEGHLLVIPKRHIETFLEMSDSEGRNWFDAVRAGLRIVKEKYSLDGVNIGVNEGKAAGQTIPHLHFHIIPRKVGDVEDPSGGIRGVIPGKASYLFKNS
jgi:diadenosine tetraphosphate (Ap4A) HIT family hydrolase